MKIIMIHPRSVRTIMNNFLKMVVKKIEKFVESKTNCQNSQDIQLGARYAGHQKLFVLV